MAQNPSYPPLIERDDSCRGFQDFVAKRRKWLRGNPEGEGVPAPAFGAHLDAANPESHPLSRQNLLPSALPEQSNCPRWRRSLGAVAIKKAAGIAHCGFPGSKIDCLKKPTPAPVG